MTSEISIPQNAIETASPLSAVRIALMGLLSLVTTMGIGRFAFTPLLPMMLHDGTLTLAEGCWLAEINYLGYLVGAVLCSMLPWAWTSRGRTQIPDVALAAAGLVATVVLTLGMALPWPASWPWLRFLSGLASALAFVFISNWCLRRLAQHNSPALAGLVYAGSGVGIALGGLSVSALVALGWQAATGWTLLGGLGGAATLWIGRGWRRDALYAEPTIAVVDRPAPTHARPPLPIGRVLGWLMLAYGLAGFGYIITATFLPVLAREVLPGSIWVDLFWPIYGLGAALGCLLSTRLPQHWDNRLLLVACYALQALGVVIGLWWPSVAGFILGCILVGTPFTALTLFAFREIRQRWPRQAASAMGLMTVVYAVGQILGPPLVGTLLRGGSSPAESFALSQHVAGACLLTGAAIWLAVYWYVPAQGAVRA